MNHHYQIAGSGCLVWQSTHPHLTEEYSGSIPSPDSNFPPMQTEVVVMAQVIVFLPPTWETWLEFLSLESMLSLAQPQPLQAFGE